MDSWRPRARITVLMGHMGSGKTEIALNLCGLLAAEGRPFALADLDVVNPYFRSREQRALLEDLGGTVIASSPACQGADLPSMPPEMESLFQREELRSVIDVGGDASGARVLARYRSRLLSCGAQVLCVLNANRPRTSTPQEAIQALGQMESICGVKIQGLVNNTHYFGGTEREDLLRGAALAEEVSRKTGLPVEFHAVREDLLPLAEGLGAPVLPLRLYMKKPWEE